MNSLKDYLESFDPDAHDAGTHVASIQAMNRLSGAAYGSVEDIRADLGSRWEVRPLNSFGRQGFVLHSASEQPGQIFCVIRGTQVMSPIDHIRNIFALPVPMRVPLEKHRRFYPLELIGGRGPRVFPSGLYPLDSHAGYTVAARGLFSQAVIAFEEFTNWGKRPLQARWAGHSAGGGIVAILAPLLFAHNPSFFPITKPAGSGVTIGASNSTTRHVARRYPFRWLSLAQNDDIVPTLPPALRKPDCLAVLDDSKRQAHFGKTHGEFLKMSGGRWLNLIAANGVQPARGALHTVTQHGWQNYMDEFEEAVFIGDWPTGSPLERSLGV